MPDDTGSAVRLAFLQRLLADRQATISESALSRVRREAEAASRLQHPGICTVYERGDDHGVPFLAMALVPGVSLAEHLARGEKLAVRLERAAAGLSRSRRRVRPRA